MPEPASAFSVRRESNDGGEAGVREHLGRDAEPARRSGRARAWTGADLTTPLAIDSGRSRRGTSASGPALVTVRSIGVANCGAPAAAQNVLTISTTGCGSGLTRWKASPVAVGQVGEVVHRLGDVVDRHHVGVAEVDADQRQPRRQPVAQQLHRREEVVGAVDLVHRAGLAVADHDRRAVDPPRHGRLLADDLLGLELRPVVRRGQVLALVEHGLVERAVVVAGRRHRRHLVEAAGLERRRRARGRCGCRRRSSPRWSRRRRSCRRSRRGGRSGRSCPWCSVDPLLVDAEVRLGEVAGDRRRPGWCPSGGSAAPSAAATPCGPGRRCRPRGGRAAPGRGAGR